MSWPSQRDNLFTERNFKTIEEAVNFYETIIVNLGVDFAMVNKDLDIVCVAPFGLPEDVKIDEVVGKNIFEALPHLVKQKYPEMIERVFESGRPIIDLYTKHRTSTGITGYFHRKIFPIIINGSCEGVINIIEDVNEQRLAALHARESEFRYQMLIENMNLVSFRLDAGGKFTYINKACLGVFEWSPAEMLGTSFVQYVHKEDVGKFWKVFWQVVNKDQEFGTVEERIVSRTGKVKHMRWNMHPLYDAEGKIIGSQGVGEDVSEKQELFENLQTAYGKYKGFFNALPVSVCIVAEEGNIVGASRRMCKLLLLSQKEMREKTIFDIILPDELARFSKVWEKLKDNGGIPRSGTALMRKDGSKANVVVNGVRFGLYYMLIFERNTVSK